MNLATEVSFDKCRYALRSTCHANGHIGCIRHLPQLVHPCWDLLHPAFFPPARPAQYELKGHTVMAGESGSLLISLKWLTWNHSLVFKVNEALYPRHFDHPAEESEFFTRPHPADLLYPHALMSSSFWGTLLFPWNSCHEHRKVLKNGLLTSWKTFSI